MADRDDVESTREESIAESLESARRIEQEQRRARMERVRQLAADAMARSGGSSVASIAVSDLHESENTDVSDLPTVDPAGTIEPAETDVEDQSISDALATVQLRREKLKLKQRRQHMKQREMFALWAMVLVSLQLVIANTAFLNYLSENIHDLDASVMIAWLSATVVEVVGIMWVIARNLFPYRDKGVAKPQAGDKFGI